ncbi:MAG: class II aldolase/adducin family protein [Proteobacteria bacterium]|nr:class II aldolase/adducin family protein [Pseudomonadota bacterium]
MSNIASFDAPLSESEWQARVDLAAAFRLVDLYGWSDLFGTHLSARVPDAPDQFLINAFGMLFDEITASSLVKVADDGTELSPSQHGINPAGFTIHSAVHAARPDIHWVIHTHTAASLGVATQADGLLPLTQQALSVLAHTGYHDYEGIAFDLSERERLTRDLGDHNVLILRNHGLLTVGRTIGEAWMWMYRAERACKFQLAFQQSGARAVEISAEIQQTTFERNRHANSAAGYRTIGEKEWPALRRKLDRDNPGYDL